MVLPRPEESADELVASADPESGRERECERRMTCSAARARAPSDPDSFARQWHILMKGSIIAAAEGDTHTAARIRELGMLLLDHHGLATT
jgi:hypothetical protein